MRTGSEKPFVFPIKVPQCGGDGSIERVPGQAAYRCVAKDSFELMRQRFYYFVSKKALDIDGVGPRIIDLFLEYGIVARFDDLFSISVDDIKGLPGLGEKSAANIVSSIEHSRTVPLARFIIGLSIDTVGEETAHDLASYFGSFDALKAATKEELMHIDGIGEVVADAIIKWFSMSEHQELVDRLLQHITLDEGEQIEERLLDGKIFVVTGTLEHFSRDEAKDLIRKYGGTVSSSVSKKTDHLLCGKDPGSKLDKARALGVGIRDEQEFLTLIGK
jgi:DNA ligase (NAD+)